MLRHSSGFCVELSTNNNNRDVFMAACEPSNPYQKWFWKTRLDNSTKI
jgi:hypothetical protein